MKFCVAFLLLLTVSLQTICADVSHLLNQHEDRAYLPPLPVQDIVPPKGYTKTIEHERVEHEYGYGFDKRPAMHALNRDYYQNDEHYTQDNEHKYVGAHDEKYYYDEHKHEPHEYKGDHGDYYKHDEHGHDAEKLKSDHKEHHDHQDDHDYHKYDHKPEHQHDQHKYDNKQHDQHKYDPKVVQDHHKHDQESEYDHHKHGHEHAQHNYEHDQERSHHKYAYEPEHNHHKHDQGNDHDKHKHDYDHKHDHHEDYHRNDHKNSHDQHRNDHTEYVQKKYEHNDYKISKPKGIADPPLRSQEHAIAPDFPVDYQPRELLFLPSNRDTYYQGHVVYAHAPNSLFQTQYNVASRGNEFNALNQRTRDEIIPAGSAPIAVNVPNDSKAGLKSLIILKSSGAEKLGGNFEYASSAPEVIYVAGDKAGIDSDSDSSTAATHQVHSVSVETDLRSDGYHYSKPSIKFEY